MEYTSGAHGTETGIVPVNRCRGLRVLFQWGGQRSLELEFMGLELLRLHPAREEYTCEITEAALIWEKGLFLWSNRAGTREELLAGADTLILAEELRFRWPTENEKD